MLILGWERLLKRWSLIISGHNSMEIKVLHLFLFLNTLNILIHMDHGIIPAATQSIAESLSLDEGQLGLLGSIVFLGIVVNGLVAGRLYQFFESKKVMLSALVMSQLSLLLFVYTQDFRVALLARFLTGAFQVFHIVFLPVWIDRNGGEHKTLWLTSVQVCIPLGIFLGYGLTSVLISYYSWRLAFMVQICLILVSLSLLMLVNDEVLDIKGLVQAGGQPAAYSDLLRQVFGSRLYLLSTLAFSILLFVSTGIQFWMTDYFIKVLKADRTIVNFGFVLISVSAPTTGTVFGGYVIHRLGGYEHNPRAVYALFLISVVGIVPACLIPFLDSFSLSAFLLWTLLFFGGGLVPGLTGLIMSSVPAHLRSFGNSKAEIVKNLLGYFPSPFLYGMIVAVTGQQRAGLMLTIFTGLLAPLFLFLACLHVRNKPGLNEYQINQQTL